MPYCSCNSCFAHSAKIIGGPLKIDPLSLGLFSDGHQAPGVKLVNVPAGHFSCETHGCPSSLIKGIIGDTYGLLGLPGYVCKPCYDKAIAPVPIAPSRIKLFFAGQDVTYDPLVVAPAAKRKKCDCSREKIMSVGCKDHA